MAKAVVYPGFSLNVQYDPLYHAEQHAAKN